MLIEAEKAQALRREAEQKAAQEREERRKKAEAAEMEEARLAARAAAEAHKARVQAEKVQREKLAQEVRQRNAEERAAKAAAEAAHQQLALEGQAARAARDAEETEAMKRRAAEEEEETRAAAARYTEEQRRNQVGSVDMWLPNRSGLQERLHRPASLQTLRLNRNKTPFAPILNSEPKEAPKVTPRLQDMSKPRIDPQQARTTYPAPAFSPHTLPAMPCCDALPWPRVLARVTPRDTV